MISITTLSVLIIITILLIKIPVFHFFTRLFNKKVKFIATLKTLLLFEIIYFALVCLYPVPKGQPLYPFWLSIMSTLLIIGATYLLFYVINRFTKIVDFRKSIGLFLIMFLVIVPIISFLANKIVMVTQIVTNINTDTSALDEYSFIDFINTNNLPLSWRLLEKAHLSLGNDLLMRHISSIFFSLYY